MLKVAPFHSANPNLRQDLKVYHDVSTCTEGNNIERHHPKSVTDMRPQVCDLQTDQRITLPCFINVFFLYFALLVTYEFAEHGEV